MRKLSSHKDREDKKAPQETLIWLESCCENMSDLLESYRYLQPDGKPLSASVIDKISHLHRLHEAIAHHEQECDYHMKMIQRYQYELHCVENGIEARKEPFYEILAAETF